MYTATNMHNSDKLSMRELIIAIIVSLIVLALCAIGDTLAYGQEPYKVSGNTYESLRTPRAKQEPVSTGFLWKDSKGKEYPILMSSTGSCFVIKVSSKTGKEYRQYLGEEISRDICARLGKTYTPRQK